MNVVTKLFLLVLTLPLVVQAALLELPSREARKIMQASSQLRIDGAVISFSAEPYINSQPKVIFSDPNRSETSAERSDCPNGSQVIIPVQINTSVLPKKVVIQRVLMHSEVVWWASDFNFSDARTLNGKTFLTVRDCIPFKFDQVLDIALELFDKGVKKYVRTTPMRIAIVS